MNWLNKLNALVAIAAIGCGGGANEAKAPPEAGAGMPGSASSAGSDSGVAGASGSNASGSAGSSRGGSPSGSMGGSAAGSVGLGSACKGATPVCLKNTTRPGNAPALTTGAWLNISPPQVPFATVPNVFTQGLATDPCDSSTLYLTISAFDIVAANAGIYKSVDAGSTWRHVSGLDEPIHIVVDPNDSNHLYAVDGVRGNSEGFWTSCDGGESFYQTDGFKALEKAESLFQYDVYDIAVDPTDFNHILLAHHGAWGWTDTKWNTSSGVLESNDGGENWIVHPPMDGWGTGHAINFLYDPELKIGDRNTWLLGTQGAGMYRTSDAGKTWKKVSEVGIQHGGGDIYYDKAGFVYASAASSIIMSKDNGATFSPVTLPVNGGFNTVFGDGTSVFLAPDFGNSHYYTSPEGDGVSWQQFSAQTFGSGPFSMGFDSANNVLYSANWTDGMWAVKVR